LYLDPFPIEIGRRGHFVKHAVNGAGLHELISFQAAAHRHGGDRHTTPVKIALRLGDVERQGI